MQRAKIEDAAKAAMWTDTRARYAIAVNAAMWSTQIAAYSDAGSSTRAYWVRNARHWTNVARHIRRTTPRRRFALP